MKIMKNKKYYCCYNIKNNIIYGVGNSKLQTKKDGLHNWSYDETHLDSKKKDLKIIECDEHTFFEVSHNGNNDESFTIHNDILSLDSKICFDSWKEINIPFGPNFKYVSLKQDCIQEDSFVKRKLNKPGTLIEVKRNDSKKKTYLIGDINPSGGFDDDGIALDAETIVLRYKVIC